MSIKCAFPLRAHAGSHKQPSKPDPGLKVPGTSPLIGHLTPAGARLDSTMTHALAEEDCHRTGCRCHDHIHGLAFASLRKIITKPTRGRNRIHPFRSIHSQRNSAPHNTLGPTESYGNLRNSPSTSSAVRISGTELLTFRYTSSPRSSTIIVVRSAMSVSPLPLVCTKP